MSSQESTASESTALGSSLEKTNSIIVVGSMEEAKKLLGNKDNYVTKEDHKKTLAEVEVLGSKYNRLLYEFNFFKAKMTDALNDMSSREDDFVKRMSTELTLFKSEKTKSVARIRNSKNIYEEQAKKACNPLKRPVPSSDSSGPKRVKK